MWKKCLEVMADLKIIQLITSPIQTNTYILYKDDGAVLIDPGDDAELIKSVLDEKGLSCKNVLLTHSHFDHCNAAKFFQDLGADVCMYKDEAFLLENGFNLSTMCYGGFNFFKPNRLFSDKDIFTFCNIDFKVLHTPGHTKGSCCYVTDSYLFSGDTLFRLGRGRTDFPTGNELELNKSIKALYLLDGDYKVFPGHGELTTLDFERRYNNV